MVAVRMVQVAIDQVIRVVAVRHLRMAAIGAVDVARRMSAALMVGRAGVRVNGIHFEHAFVDVVAVGVMQMAIVQIVDVPVVFDRQMAAIGTVRVFVPFYFRASSHDVLLVESQLSPAPWESP